VQYPEAAVIEGELIWKGESIEEVIERILTTGSLQAPSALGRDPC
jgi:hypothetical protein